MILSLLWTVALTPTTTCKVSLFQIAVAVKESLLYSPYQKWQQIPKAFGKQRCGTRIKLNIPRSQGDCKQCLRLETRFLYLIFPNIMSTPLLYTDFLSNKTINVASHSIFLIQYLNPWSAVWAEQSGVMAAYAASILYYRGVTRDAESRGHENLNMFVNAICSCLQLWVKCRCSRVGLWPPTLTQATAWSVIEIN